MSKIYLLSINEDLDSGLLQDQFVNPFKSLTESSYEITIINIHRFDKSGYRDKTFNVINLPILIPYRLFIFNRLFFLTPIIAFLYSVCLSLIVEKDSRVISRSYFPSFVALILNQLKGSSYVFDARSLFIHEHDKRLSGINKKMWKKIERGILKNSLKNVSVSKFQKVYYDNIIERNKEKNIIVHCFYNLDKNLTESEKKRIRNSLSLSIEDEVICYYGSLNSWWNNIDMYKKIFSSFIEQNIYVLIISQDYDNLKKDNFFNQSKIILLNTNKYQNHDKYIQISDYGIVTLQKNKDWKTRLSVKFAAYMCNGIPVIVGRYVGEAVRLSKKYFHNINIVAANEKIVEKYNLEKNSSEINIQYLKSKGEDLFGHQNVREYLS